VRQDIEESLAAVGGKTSSDGYEFFFNSSIAEVQV
jgi:hypothetical protein